jgi:hypothetical protein
MIEIPVEHGVPLRPGTVVHVSLPGVAPMLAEVRALADEHALAVPIRHEPR